MDRTDIGSVCGRELCSLNQEYQHLTPQLPIISAVNHFTHRLETTPTQPTTNLRSHQRSQILSKDE